MQHSEFPSSAQGDMEQALENYDICTEMLQSSAAARAVAGAEQRDVVIRLPNLHNDSVVSLEEVSGSFLMVFLGQRRDLSVRTRRASHVLSRAGWDPGEAALRHRVPQTRRHTP